MGKVRGCLLNLARSGAPMVPGERGFYPSPAKWASYHEGNVEAVQTATRRSPQPRQLFLGDSITRGPGSKARPGWPASAAQAAGWPRLAEAQGQPAAWPGAARALRKEPAGQSLSRLVSEIGAVSRRTEVPGARQVVRPRCSRLVSAVTRRPTFCGAFGTSAWSKCPRSQRPVRPSTAPEVHPLARGGPLGRGRQPSPTGCVREATRALAFMPARSIVADSATFDHPGRGPGGRCRTKIAGGWSCGRRNDQACHGPSCRARLCCLVGVIRGRGIAPARGYGVL